MPLLNYEQATVIANNVDGHLDGLKRRAIAVNFVNGIRNCRGIASAAKISPQTANKYLRALKAAENGTTELPAIQAPTAPDLETPPPSIDFKIPDGEPIELEADEHGNAVLTGRNYLSMVESLMLSANSDGRVRDFKMLSDIRNGIVDVAAELPQTAVDIERTLGLDGLHGMDTVLADTMSQLTTHFANFPKLYATLCSLFGRDPESWRPDQQTTLPNDMESLKAALDIENQSQLEDPPSEN